MGKEQKPGRKGKPDRQKGRRAPKEDDDSAQVLGPMPSRGQVDGETQKYYSEIMGLMETITDDTERAVLCANALEEAHGKEMSLACHPSCGRVLEKLLQASDAANCTSFLARCTSSFSSMAMDPSASHVAETGLKCLAEALQCSNDGVLVSSIRNALARISEALPESIVDMMRNRYGSHVLRTLIFLLAGLPFDTEKDLLSRKLGSRIHGKENEKKTIHSGFPEILERLTTSILMLNETSIRELRIDTSAGAVFQTILKVMHSSGHDTTEAITIFLGSLEGDGDVVNGFLQMMEDQNASHLVEIALEVASEDVYVKLLQKIFLPHLNRLAMHHFANFVVQTLISCAHQPEQIKLILDELGESFGELIKNNRAGVIASLLGACSRYNTRQNEVTRALAAAIAPASRDILVPRLLRLESYDKSSSKMSTLGCAMLQTIFTYPQESSQQFKRSFSVLGSVELLAAVKDRAGCHVVEAFLKSSASSKQKYSVIERLKGHFTELALDARSHYIVTKCYDAADMRLKEAIVSEMVPIQQELSKMKHGPYILGKLSVAKYEKVPDKWRSSAKSRQVIKDDYARLFDEGKRDELPVEESDRQKKKRKADVGKTDPVDDLMLQLGYQEQTKTKTKIKKKKKT